MVARVSCWGKVKAVLQLPSNGTRRFEVTSYEHAHNKTKARTNLHGPLSTKEAAATDEVEPERSNSEGRPTTAGGGCVRVANDELGTL